MSDPKHGEPLKWKKYLLLVQFGFLKRGELVQDIRRYGRSEQTRLIDEIRSDLRVAAAAGHRFLYVIKLVSTDLPGRLPNFRVETTRDLHKASGFFADHANDDHAEIWFCRTRVDDRIFSVAGRFVFTPTDSSHEQAVEQVWRRSPRLLEELSDSTRFPYVRASRHRWGWPYAIEDLRVPVGRAQDRRKLEQEFLWSMRLFEEQREPIQLFQAFLESFRFRAYSLEYKIVGSRLTLIDWDTPDDRLVVASCESALVGR